MRVGKWPLEQVGSKSLQKLSLLGGRCGGGRSPHLQEKL